MKRTLQITLNVLFEIGLDHFTTSMQIITHILKKIGIACPGLALGMRRRGRRVKTYIRSDWTRPNANDCSTKHPIDYSPSSSSSFIIIASNPTSQCPHRSSNEYNLLSNPDGLPSVHPTVHQLPYMSSGMPPWTRQSEYGRGQQSKEPLRERQ